MKVKIFGLRFRPKVLFLLWRFTTEKIEVAGILSIPHDTTGNSCKFQEGQRYRCSLVWSSAHKRHAQCNFEYLFRNAYGQESRIDHRGIARSTQKPTSSLTESSCWCSDCAFRTGAYWHSKRVLASFGENIEKERERENTRNIQGSNLRLPSCRIVC